MSDCMRRDRLIQPAGRRGAFPANHAQSVAADAKDRNELTKIVPLLGVLLMALHLIWPLNLPGLRKRRDFWKIAVVMGIAIVITALLREQASISQ